MRFSFIMLALALSVGESKACGPLRALFGWRGGCSSCTVRSTVRSDCTTCQSTTLTVCDGNQCRPVRTAIAATANVAAKTLGAVGDILTAPRDALAEVNALRAARGLPAFIYDEKLTIAAQKCAEFRASHRITFHTENDFSFIPAGGSARASGTGVSSGQFSACCILENYKHAGAAVVEVNGRRFCQVFVR